jgi:ABC-type antimicrobial peptide transport system, ATPase component
MSTFIEMKNVVKSYQMGEVMIHASNGVDFSIEKGELVVIVGPSGAGKTTVLNLLGGMDTPTSGEIIIDKQNIEMFTDKELTTYRRNDIGFVFQFYNLIQNLTVLENVELASQICKDPLPARAVLQSVQLSHRADNFPSQLSGGEQQRVAIARAIAKNPKLLLCDEPTGALDYQTGKAILTLLREMSREYQMTVVIITHNSALAPMADRVIHLKNGAVDTMQINPTPVPVESIEW